MKNEIYNILIIFALVGILTALVIIILGIKTDGSQCLQNPLIYGVEELSYANDAPVQCQCTLLKSPPIHFSFDETGFIDPEPIIIGNITVPNISL